MLEMFDAATRKIGAGQENSTVEKSILSDVLEQRKKVLNKILPSTQCSAKK